MNIVLGHNSHPDLNLLLWNFTS